MATYIIILIVVAGLGIFIYHQTRKSGKKMSQEKSDNELYAHNEKLANDADKELINKLK